MKAEINKNKQILILPENGAEAMGLEAWCDRFFENSGEIGFVLTPLNKDGNIEPTSSCRVGKICKAIGKTNAPF